MSTFTSSTSFHNFYTFLNAGLILDNGVLLQYVYIYCHSDHPLQEIQRIFKENNRHLKKGLMSSLKPASCPYLGIKVHMLS